jgi:hypothetical protein
MGHHVFLDGTGNVVRGRGMKELARLIHDRVGEGFPLTHVDTPFAFQFFLNSMVSRTSAEHAARLLAGPDAAFVAVHDLDALRAALGPHAVPVHVVAQWPVTGEAYVRVVSNRARLEWTEDMSAILPPIVVRTHGVHLVRKQGRKFVLDANEAGGVVVFTNGSGEPQLVRALIVGRTSEVIEERVIPPGRHWELTSPPRGSPPAGTGRP